MSTPTEHDIATSLQDVPHSRVLGMQLVREGEDECELLIPYAEHLVGDPDTGVIHG